jgi:pyruvate formate lyase activating enzyme
MESSARVLPVATSYESPTLPIVNAVASGDDTVGYVHSIETCGTVDGPGLRYVLFLGGCPLRCLYCHNPDAQGRPRGEQTTAGEALEDVLRYRNFIRDGGLTISGGEPLLQADFVTAVFAGAKRAGLHTALDTSGFRGDRASDELLSNTDLVLLDIKSFLPDTYKRVTGVAIDSTLEFARRLERRGIEVWIRFVLVPGLTDDEANIAGVARFVASLDNVNRVKVLPFHKLGEHKYADLGIDYQLASTPPASPEQVNRAREIFARNGVEAR